MRFEFIAKNKDMLPINRLCQIMNVSARGYRAFCSRPLSNSQCKDLVVLAHVREQFALSLGSYGRPRMTEELKEAGVDVGHRRVGRIMRENGIRVERTKKYKVTTDSNHTFNIAPNLLAGDFHATAPNQKWASDISYIWTREGWLYLAVVIDLYSRRVVGWAVSNRMKRDLAIRALPPLVIFSAKRHCRSVNGDQPATTIKGLHPSQRPWQPILFSRLPENPETAWVPGVDVR